MTPKNNDIPPKTICGSCAIIGPTNAGKSTLMNTILGTKVSIVSRKVQTTRCRIQGIYSKNNVQIIFVDTPGLFNAKQVLDHAMLREVWQTLDETDAVLLIVDASAKNGLPEQAIAKLAKRKNPDQPIFLALNKCDEVHPKEKLLKLAGHAMTLLPFTAVFMITGKNGDGVDDVIKTITQHLPEGPFLYPEDQVTDIPDAFQMAEITREHVFDRLHQELPYNIMVDTTKVEDAEDGSITIHQDILVMREQHKAMVIGKGATTLKQIGAAARHDLEHMYDTRVHLFLNVRVEENWATKESFLMRSGLMRF